VCEKNKSLHASHCTGNEQEKKESEIGIRKRKRFNMRAKVRERERWSNGDMQWKTVPQMSRRDRKCSVADGREP